MDARRRLSVLGVVLWTVMAGRPAADRSAPGAIDATAQPAAAGQSGRVARTAPAREREHIIEGTKADDVLSGGDGDDWLFGLEGADVLRGGAGRDTIEGGAGDDALYGGPGRDVLDGGAGRDTLAGGEDNDFMDGGDDDDLLDGGPGDDDIDGGDGDDVLNGGPGDDVLSGGDGNDVIGGGDGADRLFGRDGDDRLSGGPGDDLIDGGDGRDTLDGDDGHDTLDGGENDDVLRGGAGNDTLKGESGNDILLGGAGNDTLMGSRGDDSLDGGEDHDTIVGGDGGDTLYGRGGDDVLIPGTGSDVVNGHSGDDLIVVRAGDVPGGELELIDGGGGTDTLILNGFPPVGDRPSSDGDHTLIDPATAGTYRLVSVEHLQHAHLFTNVGTTETARASFVFVNPSLSSASARIMFFAHDGAALPQQIGGTTPSGQPFTVPAHGRVRFAVSGPAQAARGSALVLSDQPLGGFVETTLSDSGPAGGGEARLVDSFMIPVARSKAAATETGVAVFASTVPSNVKLTLHRMNGEEVSTASQGAAEIAVPANGHRLVFVGDLFAFAGDEFEGTLTVEGGIDRPQDGGPLAAIGLQRDKTGIVSFPVVPVSPAIAGAAFHFASLPVGGEHRTTITLVNPSPTTRARGTMSFFDPDGQGRAVAWSGQRAAAAVPYEIAPLGSAVFSAPAGGPVRPGAARAVSREGVVGAVAHLASGTTATFRAGPSEVGNGFIAPVNRDRATGVNTSIALSSTQSAVTVTLVLTDSRGTEVAGGRAQAQLAANGALLQTLDALFPKADLSDFQGSVTVRPEGGAVALAVTQSGPGGVTALPVVPLR